LQTENPRAVLEQLIEQRDPLYRDCCDLLIRTDRRHPRGVVNDIIRFLKRQQPLKKI
jgi:shikimate kinase